MASESEPEVVAASEKDARSKQSERPRKKKSKRPRPPIPRTEAEIDSPTKQTVGMLGILGGLTLVMWALAHGACNYHPPKETRSPRQVPTAELAADPKNAAVEFQQRLLTHDFDGALELATGAEVAEVQKAKAACGAACQQAREKLGSSVVTAGVLIAKNPLLAVARATSVGSSEATGPFEMNLERVGSLWKVSARVPAALAAPPAPSPAPAPSASVAAPASAAPAVSN